MRNTLIILILSLILYGCSDNKSRQIVVIDKSFNKEILIKDKSPNKGKKPQQENNTTKTNKQITNNHITNKSTNNMWHKPVQAKILKKYSLANNHLGLTFATKPDQEIKNVRNGVVLHISNEIKNQDNIIIIKHSFGFYSLYKYNKTIYVNEKDEVKKGQLIALTGENNLYFEIKKYSQAVNPLKYIE